MSKLQQMLLDRKRAVEAEIQKATAPLQSELREIEIALTAIGGNNAPKQASLFQGREKLSSKQSATEQILEILDNNKSGIKTVKIADILRLDYERDIKNQDVSWYLSKLKKDKKVTLENGGIWKVIDVFE